MGGMCARVCPDRGVVRRSLRAQHARRPAGAHRPAAALRHRRGVREQARRSSSARRRRDARSPWSAAGRRDFAARIGSRCSDTASTIFEPKDKLGGLNEYGIAAYKTPDDFAAREVEYILGIGGIEVRTGVALGAAGLAAGPAQAVRRGVPGFRSRRRQRARSRGRTARGRRERGRLHRRPAAGARQGAATGRAARRRDRRRHDRHRHRRAEQGARRRAGDDGLPPRPGTHERQPVRAGIRAGARRDAADLVEAAQVSRAGRGACTAWSSRSHAERGRDLRCSTRTSCSRRSARRCCGSELGRLPRRSSSSRRTASRSTKSGVPRCTVSGPAATASPAART